MDDVASAKSENLNLRKIQQKLMQWYKTLAPLNENQFSYLEQLQSLDREFTEVST